MDALPFSAGLLPHVSTSVSPRISSLSPVITKKKYVEVIGHPSQPAGSVSTEQRVSSEYFTGLNGTRRIVKPKELVFNDGIPVVSFSSEEISALASPFALTLIGKFSSYVPNIADVAPAFVKPKLKGPFNVSFLDSRHLVIRLFNEEDLNFLWLENSLFISNCCMRIFKWSPLFFPSVESLVVPVWVTLKKVPIMLFNPDALFEIVKPLGKPLKLDKATANISRLDRVRVCVKLDVSKPLHDFICLDLLGHMINIKVLYDGIPLYCEHCHKLGHEKSMCFVLNPSLKVRKRDMVEGSSMQSHEDDRDHLTTKIGVANVEDNLTEKLLDGQAQSKVGEDRIVATSSSMIESVKVGVANIEDILIEKQLDGQELSELVEDRILTTSSSIESVAVCVVRQIEDGLNNEKDGVSLNNSFGVLDNIDIENVLPPISLPLMGKAQKGPVIKLRRRQVQVVVSSSPRPPRKAKSQAVAHVAAWANEILGKRSSGLNQHVFFK